MKPQTHDRQVVSSGELKRGLFEISEKNHAHIMGILRDGLYSDKVLAVLREYGSNAWDAHREIGKDDIPIKVQIPTPMEPTLIIRDYGPGLSENDVFDLYTKYGESTKRDTDDAVGMLGIGSKSGFAYSDTFTVTSWNGGMKKVYIAVLDETDKGEINKLHEEPCGDETGLEIKIPVQPHDIYDFEFKARNLFAYFRPRPEINIKLPEFEWMEMKAGFISESSTSHSWMAVMGCVPYRLDPNQIRRELEAEGLQDTIHRLKGGIFFNIGNVRISANREELKYTDQTKEAIVEGFKKLFQEYIDDAMTTLASSKATPWEKRIKTRFLGNTLRLPVPDEYQELSRDHVVLWNGNGSPKTFRLWSEGRWKTSVHVNPHAALYLKDDNKDLKGYSVGSLSAIVTPVEGPDGKPYGVDSVRKELDTLLAKRDATGIKIAHTSSLSWYPSYGNQRTTAPADQVAKHRVTTFQLLDTWYRPPWSRCWEILEREPEEDDVFVVISGFKVVGHETFFSTYEKDKELAGRMGLAMPPVYGYKTLARKPLYPKDCTGTEYYKWRKEFFRQQMKPKWRELIRLWMWKNLFETRGHDWRGVQVARKALWIQEKLEEELGNDHPLVVVLDRHREGVRSIAKTRKKDVQILERLTKIVLQRTTAAERALERLRKTYPLLFIHGGFHSFTEGYADEWMEYVKLIDQARKP